MKIFFDHIPKTAGSSIRQFFVDSFGQEYVTSTIRSMKPSVALNLYSNMKVVIGHFDFDPTEGLPRGIFSATLVRDPRERLLSYFYFLKNNVPDTLTHSTEQNLKSLSLDEALWSDFFVSQIKDSLSIHFASHLSSNPKSLSNIELLEKAKCALNFYDLVGPYNKLNDFIDLFRKIFDINKEIILKPINITSDRKKFSDLPRELQSRITSLVETDMLLWEYAEGLFDKKKNRILNTALAINDNVNSLKHSIPAGESKESNALDIESEFVELINAQIHSTLSTGSTFINGELATLSINLKFNQEIYDLTVGYSIHHESGLLLFGTNTQLLGKKINTSSDSIVRFSFPFTMNLGFGSYYINISVHTGLSHLDTCFLLKQKLIRFDIVGFLDKYFEGLTNLVPSIHINTIAGESPHIDIQQATSTRYTIDRSSIVIEPKGSIKFISMPKELILNAQTIIPCFISNNSDQAWLSAGNNPVFISYHWRNLNNELIVRDGLRTPLPAGVIQPHTEIEASLVIDTPVQEEGNYYLELTLVQEGMFWFEDKGFISALAQVKISNTQTDL